MKKITNIDLVSITSYRFPVTAISSILHRISGFILIIAMPVIVLCMQLSLSESHSYDIISKALVSTWLSFFLWVFLASISYHVYAGIRHIMMDIGFGDSMITSKLTSWLVIILGVSTAIFWGCFLWL